MEGRRFEDRPRKKFSAQPPVKVGEKYRVKIEAMGKAGDGIARIKGFVIFVPKTQIGDEVEIVINNVKQKFAFAEVIG